MKTSICHQPLQSTLWPLATESFMGSYSTTRLAQPAVEGNMTVTSIRGGKDQFEGWDD